MANVAAFCGEHGAGADAGQRLAHIIEEIYAAKIPMAERRRLAARAAAAGMPQQQQAACFLQLQEELVQTAGAAGGGELRKLLKEAGRGDLDKRVAAISKARNMQAHPDPGLVREVSEAVRVSTAEASVPRDGKHEEDEEGRVSTAEASVPPRRRA